MIQRIPTKRGYLSRVFESKSFAIAVYIAIVIGVVLANLEQFA